MTNRFNKHDFIENQAKLHFFLPLSSYSLSGGMRGARPTTRVTPKLLGLFAHAQRPGAKGIPHAQGFGNRT
jgi:hypothetical protein